MHNAKYPTRNGDNQMPVTYLARRNSAREVAESCSLIDLTDYFTRHHKELHRYAGGLAQDTGMAEDMVQQAFANTFEAIERGARIEDLAKWLRRCIRNVYLEHKRRPSIALMPDVPETGSPANLAEQIDLRERWEAVEQIVDTLPESQRTAFLLAELRGLNYEELASVLGRSVAAAAQVLRRARARVREAVGADKLPLVGPLMGLRSGRPRWNPLESLLNGLRPRLGARTATLQNWLTSIAGRSLAPVTAPASSVLAAVLMLASANGQPPFPIGSELPVSASAPTTADRDSDGYTRVPARFSLPGSSNAHQIIDPVLPPDPGGDQPGVQPDPQKRRPSSTGGSTGKTRDSTVPPENDSGRPAEQPRENTRSEQTGQGSGTGQDSGSEGGWAAFSKTDEEGAGHLPVVKFNDRGTAGGSIVILSPRDDDSPPEDRVVEFPGSAGGQHEADTLPPTNPPAGSAGGATSGFTPGQGTGGSGGLSQGPPDRSEDEVSTGTSMDTAGNGSGA